jgi:hypothetical protein
MNTGFYSLNTGLYSLNTGFYSLNTGFYSMNTGFYFLNTGFDSMNTGFFFHEYYTQSPSRPHSKNHSTSQRIINKEIFYIIHPSNNKTDFYN